MVVLEVCVCVVERERERRMCDADRDGVRAFVGNVFYLLWYSHNV